LKILNINKIKDLKKKKILHRAIAGFIYATLFVYLTLETHQFFFNIFIYFLTIGSIYEIVKITNHTRKNKIILVFTILYILLSFFILIKMKNSINGASIILLLLIYTWSSDVGGYVIGSILGKKKLTKLSPKKTWEGLYGSVISCLITGLLTKNIINQNIEINWASTSIIICTACIVGDLIMSKIKRINQKKESGFFLPGHGGFLDRLDSLFLSTLIFYLLISK
jgi:phosphatidate cytidylyltransferase